MKYSIVTGINNSIQIIKTLFEQSVEEGTLKAAQNYQTLAQCPLELLPHLKMKIGNTESFLAAAGLDVCLMRTSNKLYFLFWGQNGNFELVFFFNFIATKRAIVSQVTIYHLRWVLGFYEEKKSYVSCHITQCP